MSGVKADEFGLTRQREWICNNLAGKNDWIVFADDNIRILLALPEKYYKLSSVPIEPVKEVCTHWRPLFRTPCSEERFLNAIAPDTIKHCKEIGAHLAGFTSTDNILFRKVKFRNAVYTIGKLMLWHNTREIPFDHTISMEDFYHTAENLVRYGKCVVNNYLFPRAYHYEPGGMGRYEERAAIRKVDVQKLLQRYPGLFRVKTRAGFQAGTDLQIAVSEPHIESWRLQHGRKRLV